MSRRLHAAAIGLITQPLRQAKHCAPTTSLLGTPTVSLQVPLVRSYQYDLKMIIVRISATLDTVVTLADPPQSRSFPFHQRLLSARWRYDRYDSVNSPQRIRWRQRSSSPLVGETNATTRGAQVFPLPPLQPYTRLIPAPLSQPQPANSWHPPACPRLRDHALSHLTRLYPLGRAADLHFMASSVHQHFPGAWTPTCVPRHVATVATVSRPLSAPELFGDCT